MGQFNPSDKEYDALLNHQEHRSRLNVAGSNNRFRLRGEYIYWLEEPSHNAILVFGEDLPDWIEFQKWLLERRLWPKRASAGGKSWFFWDFWYPGVDVTVFNKKMYKKGRPPKSKMAEEGWRSALPRPISLIMKHEEIHHGPYDTLFHSETILWPYYKYENTTDIELGLMGIRCNDG